MREARMVILTELTDVIRDVKGRETYLYGRSNFLIDWVLIVLHSSPNG
jgi:hypothetical protein